MEILGFETDRVTLHRGGDRLLVLQFGSNPQLIASRYKNTDGWQHPNWRLIDNYWYPRRGNDRGFSEPWPVETTAETIAEALREAVADHKVWLETGVGPDKLEGGGA